MKPSPVASASALHRVAAVLPHRRHRPPLARQMADRRATDGTPTPAKAARGPLGEHLAQLVEHRHRVGGRK
jgi:hypothetical protein